MSEYEVKKGQVLRLGTRHPTPTYLPHPNLLLLRIARAGRADNVLGGGTQGEPRRARARRFPGEQVTKWLRLKGRFDLSVSPCPRILGLGKLVSALCNVLGSCATFLSTSSAHFAYLPTLQDRDDKEWMKHTISYMASTDDKVKIAYRPVHYYTLDEEECKVVPPVARVY